MTSVNDIRETFLDYFETNDHRRVASSSLVPMNDPTLMFTNAGMVPFKNLFTGLETRDYVRAVSSQKCVRAGGKHNDLDNVGYTARHHTFFEMLGNFSFGDYFKEQAIHHAWTLLTKGFELDASRLLVTVYHDDAEAFGLWKKIAGLPEDRIIKIATSDNFWAMGDTGPCGPCSEIFYDHGDHIAGGPPGSPDEDGDRFVEIWNLVFMQFEQQSADKRVNLPKPSIDTGMGLERIAAVLQGTHDNYEIDTFRKLISASEDITGIKSTDETKAAHRVIADHARAACFLIADGVLPSNDGRGYVLRRIMRRAMRYAHVLNPSEKVMYQILPTLIQEMGSAFPELRRAEALISETLQLEEGKFKETLDRGLKLLAQEVEKLGEGQPLSGEVAFKLYDTYGFPLDLTEDALRREGRSVNTDEFKLAMQKQRELARANWTGSGQSATDAIWFDLRENLGATDFIGYESTSAEGQIVGIVKDGKQVDEVRQGEDAILIANQTPFYGESGGQVGDKGLIKVSADIIFEVADTKKMMGDVHAHIGKVAAGSIKTNDFATFLVDEAYRDAVRCNHSSTHLVHEALRRVLGEHVTQKGSLVAAERFRFDFSHPKAVSAKEIDEVERMVNKAIRSNGEVRTRLMSPDEAIEAGAMALFGEKYGDEVRVVAMGDDDMKPNFSVELCGGTHVKRSGDIGFFKIIGESAVASGVRRIEAVTGEAAFDHVVAREELLNAAADTAKVGVSDLPSKISSLIKEKRDLERAISDLKKNLLNAGGKSGADTETLGKIKFVGQVLDEVGGGDLRAIADEAKKNIGSGVVALVGINGGKASLLVAITDDLTADYNAVDLVRKACTAIGGKGGGGRPDMAQAGGPDGAKAQDAIDTIRQTLMD